jgi:transcriptional regulator of acetoin/glycerol metabolism
MASVLIAWVSDADIDATGPNKVAESRIHRVVADEFYANVILLSTQSKKAARSFRKWLSQEVGTPIELDRVKLNSELDFNEVYDATLGALEGARVRIDEEEIEWSFLLGSESPILDAVLIHLAQSHGAELLHWTPSEGLKVIDSRMDLGQIKPERTLSGTKPEADLEAGGPVLEKLSKHALELAKKQVPVLIHGEIGVGRELLAEAMHGASSRREAPFFVMDCDTAALEDLDHVLFAENGVLWTRATVFLESIHALPAALQARLTRVLRDGRIQSKSLRARIIASTDLAPEALLSAIRPDLFHLLAIGIVHVPPLRQRKEEILSIAELILRKLSEDFSRNFTLASGCEEVLVTHNWPGNLRELEGTLRRASLLSGDEISIATLSASIIRAGAAPKAPIEVSDLQEYLDAIARDVIAQTMERVEGNKTQAARELGLNSYQTLTNWMKRLGVE